MFKTIHEWLIRIALGVLVIAIVVLYTSPNDVDFSAELCLISLLIFFIGILIGYWVYKTKYEEIMK